MQIFLLFSLFGGYIARFFVNLYYTSAVVAQLVEHRLPKPRATGSSPAYRSFIDEQQFLCCSFFCRCA